MRLKLLAAAFLPVGAVLLSTSDLFAQGGIPLQGNPFKEWNEKTIMIFSPHPDDDVIGCGGALAFLSGRGNRLIVVYLTNGEKGTFDPSMKSITLGGGSCLSNSRVCGCTTHLARLPRRRARFRVPPRAAGQAHSLDSKTSA